MPNTLEESFVPLTSAPVPAGVRPEFRPGTVAGGDSGQTFQAFGLPVKAPPAAPPRNCEPRVTLQNQGNLVSGIRIECSCGQVIELECVYPPAPAPEPVPAPTPAPVTAAPAVAPAAGVAAEPHPKTSAPKAKKKTAPSRSRR